MEVLLEGGEDCEVVVLAGATRSPLMSSSLFPCRGGWGSADRNEGGAGVGLGLYLTVWPQRACERRGSGSAKLLVKADTRFEPEMLVSKLLFNRC